MLIVRLRKYTILTHRWLGVFFCLLFAVWFVSGIVLMYCEFPVVSARDRLQRAPVLDAAKVRLSPAEAFEKLQPADTPTQVHLLTLDGRPVYRFHFGRSRMLVFADNGEVLDTVSAAVARRIAASWTGLDAAATQFLTSELDQWSVLPEVRRAAPYWKQAWLNGEEVYVSQETGEVVQHTTRASRIGAYFGAIPHWLYFTALRKDTALWANTVTWLAAAGSVMSLVGIVVGLWLYSPSIKRYRFPNGRSSIPYAGQKRLHTIFGLIFGLVVFTWILSGMFSMNPLSWSPDSAAEAPVSTLRADSWEERAFAALDPRTVLRAGQYRELELAQVLGRAVYLAKESPDSLSIFPVGSPARDEFDANVIARAISAAAAPYQVAETRRVTRYEPYYIDRHFRKPLPALFVRLNDPEQSIYYVDLKTARVVESYDGRSRLARWLYHGLHSMDLPWLYRNRPAWDITVLALMAAGTFLSITSVVIGWRRLRQKARQANIVV